MALVEALVVAHGSAVVGNGSAVVVLGSAVVVPGSAVVVLGSAVVGPVALVEALEVTRQASCQPIPRNPQPPS